MEESYKKKNKILPKIVIVLVTFFLGAAAMYFLVYKYPTVFIKTKNINTTKVVKDVKITDDGISDSVEKIYDAVVVVETYKGETLIGSGTGFIYKKEKGYAFILTNNHVISSGDKIKVTFTDGKKLDAKVLGSDKYADIAVLEIDAFDGMSICEIGSSEEAKVGDTVFAVGAPIDNAYSWTVTRGILSGKNRLIEINSLNNTSLMSDWVMTAIQTDAAINSGNSGGPLANANGQVIGITSMKLVKNGVEGMGFAIPIEIALHYTEKLEKGEEVIRPYLGVSMYNVSQIGGQYYATDKTTTGVYIGMVEDNSPADKAGLKKGDIIVKINDEEIENIAYLKYNLYKYDVGDKIKVTVYRGNDKKTVEITLGENKNNS